MMVPSTRCASSQFLAHDGTREWVLSSPVEDPAEQDAPGGWTRSNLDGASQRLHAPAPPTLALPESERRQRLAPVTCSPERRHPIVARKSARVFRSALGGVEDEGYGREVCFEVVRDRASDHLSPRGQG